MYWFAGTGTAEQIINTVKLPVLSKILKKSMVTKVLADFSLTTSSHLLTIYYDCAESVVCRRSKK